MSFNKGFYCALCGPMEKAAKKTIKKIPYNICPKCMEIVEIWERPNIERDGRCHNCGHGAFTAAIVKGHILRCCKKCNEVIDLDNKNAVVRKGELQK